MKKEIDLYIKYINKEEEYKKDYGKSFDLFSKEILNKLSNLDLKELVDIYLNYTTIYYLRMDSKVEKLLNSISEIIVSKLDTISLMKLIDIHTIVFSAVLKCDENIENSENIINARNRKIENGSYLKQLSKSQDLTANEKAKNDYLRITISYEKNLVLYKKVRELLDTIYNDFSIYLEIGLEKINDTEVDHLLSTINSRIEKNANEILERNNVLHNPLLLEVKSRFSNDSLHDLRESLSTTYLKNSNYVYESYRDTLEKRKESTKINGN